MKVQIYCVFVAFMLVSMLAGHSLLAQAGVQPKAKAGEAINPQQAPAASEGATIELSTGSLTAPERKQTNPYQEQITLTASGDRIVVPAKPDPLVEYRKGKSMSALELLKLDPAAQIEVVDNPTIFNVEPQTILAAAVKELPVTLQLFVQKHANLYNIR